MLIFKVLHVLSMFTAVMFLSACSSSSLSRSRSVTFVGWRRFIAWRAAPVIR